MVLEKLVKLDFDKRTGKLIIANTKQEAINPIQLSNVVILQYNEFFGVRLKVHEENAPKDANSYMGNIAIEIFMSKCGYHPLVYYKIDDVQAKNSLKKEVIENNDEFQDIFGGEVD